MSADNCVKTAECPAAEHASFWLIKQTFCLTQQNFCLSGGPSWPCTRSQTSKLNGRRRRQLRRRNTAGWKQRIPRSGRWTLMAPMNDPDELRPVGGLVACW